jgi:hypothetical protein
MGKKKDMNQNDEIVPHFPQNKDTADSKLRRGHKHCPVCLTAFVKNATRTRLLKKCVFCQAQPSQSIKCSKCLAADIWQNKTQAACQSCGLHGKKSEVIVS